MTDTSAASSGELSRYNPSVVRSARHTAFTDFHVPGRRSSRWIASSGKRIFDIVLAIMLLPLLAPLIGILWMIVRMDGAPGFFGHSRVGHKGMPLTCWKLRTMVPGADAGLQAYLSGNPAAATEWARDFKLTKDPRITPVGALLHQTSLDELPQIWNVLKGEMSFVGPRPVIRDELRRYAGVEQEILAQKPGVTCLWQVSGRNATSYEERVQLHLQYLREASFFLDLKIILRTIFVVFRGTGQ